MNACRAPLIIRTCRHVLDSGSRCRGPAVGGRVYCRHHLESRLRLRRIARVRRRTPVLQLYLLTDEAAIRHAIAHIDAGLADGRIDRDSGPVLLRAIRMAEDLVHYRASCETGWGSLPRDHIQ